MKQMNLLLLEDNIDDAYLVINTLVRSGMNFRHMIVSDKDGFLTALKHNSFHAILADNALPSFSAGCALQIMQKECIKLPFILVTGSISEEFAVEIMKEGAWDYILKDRLQRLPNAVLGAVNKHLLETERQKYLNDIIVNEGLMKKAERLANFGSWEIDMQLKEDHWSDEHYRILDYTPGEVQPSVDNFINRVHPADKRMVQEKINEAFEYLERQKFSCRLWGQSGEVKYIQCEMGIIRDDGGRILLVNGITRDVTENINAGELLQKSEANLRAIFENADTGYALLDYAYNIISFNQPINNFALDELGKELSEGTNAIEYFSVEAQDKVRELLDSAIKGIPVNYEIPYPREDGSNKWYYVGFHPVYSHDKSVLGVIISQTDITTRKTFELQEKRIAAELIQRNNDLEQFTYIVSHNLRSPVANIMGISDALQSDGLEPHDKEYLMNGLVASIKNLDSIINDLNVITQMKQALNEKKEVAHFARIVEDVSLSLKNMTENKFVHIHCNFDEVEGMMTVKSYLHSIFYNLISNSIKYRQPGIPLLIKICSRKLKRGLELVFSDNGIGIDLQRKGNQVFGLYKRFHPNNAEGKGMGLFMVKNHVESIGGKITIESEVNKGTEFSIVFDCIAE